jgi:histidine triad (HIT) family protein
MSDCVFCKILAGQIPSTKVYADDDVYAFQDLHPLAKTHVLFVHRKHTANVNGMSVVTVGQVYQAIKNWTAGTELENEGFRVVTNVNAHAGQTVFHTHFHVLGGEKLGGFGR